MQQLVNYLAGIFGNSFDKDHPYVNDGYQFATYMIMGAIGLVGGLATAMVICRKPLPPVDILEAKSTEKNTKEVAPAPAVLEASPLVTQKYPPY